MMSVLDLLILKSAFTFVTNKKRDYIYPLNRPGIFKYDLKNKKGTKNV
jgi:hypothetical protein